MTGAQHYVRAESLLRIVENSEGAPNTSAQLLAEAQVHATLALAAAKAIGLNLAGYGGERGAP